MRTALAAWLVILCSAQALAGPDAISNRFLTDSPSMMDWGLERLSRHLQENPTYGPDMGATFDWDRNAVLIYNTAVAPAGETLDAFEFNCRVWFLWVRGDGYVSAADGTVFGTMEASRFASFFEHVGYNRTIGGIDESDALQALDKLIMLEYRRWSLDDDFEVVNERTCTGKLLGTGFSISRE